MPKTFQFPVWLQGTPEEQKAEADRQALALAVHSRAHMTEAERLVGRGKLLEETARGNLAQAKGKDRNFIKDQLADALAMQGRYEEAASTHTEKHRRAYFRSVGKALEKDDAEKCRCKDKKAEIGDAEISITPRFEKARIYSPVHGELVSLVACSHCGHLNARPLRSRLLVHNDALAASDGAKRALKNDFQVLVK